MWPRLHFRFWPSAEVFHGESIGPGATQIQSFGIGYTDSPELEQLMSFFVTANEDLLENLKVYLESGTRTEWSE